MNWVLQATGAALVLLALADVFLTVLYPRSGAGLITPRLNRRVWQLLVAMAPRGRDGRNMLLSFGGPVLMVLTVAVWTVLLFAGSALFVWPALGEEIRASNGTTPTDFFAALYYSGYSLTTLGTGDLVPKTGFYRALMIFHALIGFSIITLTLTYFMSVYSAVIRRNTLAQVLHHMSAGSGDAAEIVARFGPGGSFADSRSQMASLGTSILDLLESYHSYPVLHYFRMRDPRYSTARLALLVLDGASLIETATGEDQRDLRRSASVQLLWGSGLNLIEDTCRTLLPGWKDGSEGGSQDEEPARLRYRAALAKLNRADIAGPDDLAAAEDRYLEYRRRWEGAVRAFTRLTGYEWDEIATMGHPDEAVEQGENPQEC